MAKDKLHSPKYGSERTGLTKFVWPAKKPEIWGVSKTRGRGQISIQTLLFQACLPSRQNQESIVKMASKTVGVSSKIMHILVQEFVQSRSQSPRGLWERDWNLLVQGNILSRTLYFLPHFVSQKNKR